MALVLEPKPTSSASAAIRRTPSGRMRFGIKRVFVFDFDGPGAPNQLGGEGLGNAVESTFAGGDSGSPSFLCEGGSGYECVGGRWVVAGINTFVTAPVGHAGKASTFGTLGGGMVVSAYVDWIESFLPPPPELICPAFCFTCQIYKDRFLPPLSLAIVVLTSLSRVGHADTTYEQLPPADFNGASFISSTVNGIGTRPGFRAADDFQITLDSNVDQVQWWGDPPPETNDFTFEFYADSGGIPGALLLSTGGHGLISTQASPSFTHRIYTAILDTPFAVASGTKYWFSVFDKARAEVRGKLTAGAAATAAAMGAESIFTTLHEALAAARAPHAPRPD